MNVCVCVCVCVQRVCPECPCRGHAWVTAWAGRWRACVRACGRVCRHTSPSPGAAPSAPCPVLGQVLSPFLCSGTARLLAYRPSLSILSVSFHLAVCLLCCLCPVVCSHNHRYALTSSHPPLPVDSAAVHLSVPPTHTHIHTHTHTHPGSSSVAYSVAIGNLRKK